MPPQQPPKDQETYLPMVKSFLEFLAEQDHHEDADFHKKLDQHYDMYDPEQTSALKYYTRIGSLALNNSLYKNRELTNDRAYFHNGDGNTPRTFKDLDHHLSRAMAQHTAPQDFHVYTGTKLHLPKSDDQPFMAIHNGYTSTSLNPEIAKAFSNPKIDDDNNHRVTRTLMQIHIPDGAHGAWVGNSQTSGNPHEKEFIIHKGAKFHVEPRPDTTRFADDLPRATKTIVHKAYLVHDGIKPTRYHKDES